MQQHRIAVITEEYAVASKSLYQSPELEDSEEEKVSDFGRFLRLTNTKQAVEDEFDRYCASPPEEKITNPIKWWVDYYKQYPILYKLALELYSYPKISTECKRIFSDTGKIVTPNCNCFQAALIKEEECLKKLLRMGVPGA
jgi:hypothetical protein